jgi:adenylate cyclase
MDGEQNLTRLTLDGLATEAETSPERIRRLIEIGAIRPNPDGTFGVGDVLRSRVLAAFEETGITLEQIGMVLRDRALSADYIELFYPAPSPRTGRDVRAFAAELGERGPLLGPVVAAMGLPSPGPGDATFERDEAVLRTFLEAWGVGDDEITLRAARIFGDAIRRAAEGWVALFDEAFVRPVGDRSTTVDELLPLVIEPGSRVAAAGRDLVSWLLERHVERTMTELNIQRLERELQLRGVLPPSSPHPPAVAFVDVSGYPRLTQEHGDELAARTAVRLAELAEEAVRRHGGRVVKLVGDGVLLTFGRSIDAVRTALELVAALPQGDMPPAHAGIHAGPLINRDGDVYGDTVNLASRVAGQAQAGHVVVTRDVVDAVRRESRDEDGPVGGPEPGFSFGRLVDVELKGVAGPVPLYRVRGQ